MATKTCQTEKNKIILKASDYIKIKNRWQYQAMNLKAGLINHIIHYQNIWKQIEKIPFEYKEKKFLWTEGTPPQKKSKESAQIV